jgi:hypothetical protein
MIKDRNIGYKHKREWFPATGFNTFLPGEGAPNTMASLVHGETGIGGAPPWKAIGASGGLGVVGVFMDTAGDFLRMMLPLPSHWDVDNDIHFRVLWSDNAVNAAQSITWKLLWKSFQFQQAPAAADELITLTADANSTVAHSIDATQWGTLNGGTWSEDLGFLVLDVECDVDASNLDPIFIGLEVAYIPKLTSGVQVSDQQRPSDA